MWAGYVHGLTSGALQYLWSLLEWQHGMCRMCLSTSVTTALYCMNLKLRRLVAGPILNYAVRKIRMRLKTCSLLHGAIQKMKKKERTKKTSKLKISTKQSGHPCEQCNSEAAARAPLHNIFFDIFGLWKICALVYYTWKLYIQFISESQQFDNLRSSYEETFRVSAGHRTVQVSVMS